MITIFKKPPPRTAAAQDESFKLHGANHYARMIYAFAFAAKLEAELIALQQGTPPSDSKPLSADAEQRLQGYRVAVDYPAGAGRPLYRVVQSSNYDMEFFFEKFVSEAMAAGNAEDLARSMNADPKRDDRHWYRVQPETYTLYEFQP